MNIDWLDIILPCYHTKNISGGFKASFTSEGLEDFDNLVLDYKIATNKIVEGSHSSTITIKTVDPFDDYMMNQDGDINKFLIDNLYPYLPEDYGNSLVMGKGKPAKYKGAHFFIRVSGNLAKFLQGQNLYCPSDPFGLYFDFIVKLIKQLGIAPFAEDVRKWQHGLVIPKRIDINKNFKLNNPKEVDEFITGLVKSGAINNRSFCFPRGVNRKTKGLSCTNDTLGKDFRAIFYNKFYEMLKHLKEHDRYNYELCYHNAKLINEAYGLLRVEFSFRSSWFRRRGLYNFLEFYQSGYNFNDLFDKYLKTVQVGATNMDENKLEKLKEKLPNHLLGTYLLWYEGMNVAQIKEALGGGSRNHAGDTMYFRHSKELREKYGINTKVRRIGATEKIKSNVVPMLRVLEAKECEDPQWMKDEGLIYEPKKHLLTRVK